MYAATQLKMDMASQVGKRFLDFFSLCTHAWAQTHTFPHVHTPPCSPASWFLSLQGIWGAYAACGLSVLTPQQKEEEGGWDGRVGSADGTGTPVLRYRNVHGLNEKTGSFCPCVLLNCFGGINLVLNEKS